MPFVMILRTVFFSFVLVFFAAFAGCSKEEEDRSEPVDRLDELGLTGTRVLVMRTYGNITNMAVPCCDTLVVRKDDQPNDLVGRFRMVSPGFEGEGILTANPEDSTLLFVRDGNEFVSSYTLSSTDLTMWYEEDDVLITEDWALLDN